MTPRSVLFPVLLSAGLAIAGDAAGAFCSPPRAQSHPPRLQYAQPPSKPGCLRGVDRSTAGCDPWELQSYRQGVQRYLQEVERFAARAREHARNAEAFAREAEAYARCEALELALP